jgi:hypothetical protein
VVKTKNKAKLETHYVVAFSLKLSRIGCGGVDIGGGMGGMLGLTIEEKMTFFMYFLLLHFWSS